MAWQKLGPYCGGPTLCLEFYPTLLKAMFLFTYVHKGFGWILQYLFNDLPLLHGNQQDQQQQWKIKILNSKEENNDDLHKHLQTHMHKRTTK